MNGGAVQASAGSRRALGAAMAALVVGGLLLVPATAAAANGDGDGDGLTNAFEVNKSRTSPTRKDTDRDGIPDGREDPDGDGLTNLFEQAAGTHPRKADTDGDGLRDGMEDPDADGLWNLREQQVGTNPRKADTDGDGIRDDREDPDADQLWTITDFRAALDPRDSDTDNDGIRDGAEDRDGDGLSNLWEQRLGTNVASADSDGDGLKDPWEDADADGLKNITEIVRGLDPRDPDSNDNGVLDGAEPGPPAPVLGPCQVLPADNVWNVRIDDRPVRSDSSTLIGSIGRTRTFHMDFGSYAGYGIPWQAVTNATPTRTVTFDYADESDPAPYPIPSSPLIEGGSDRHLLAVDTDTCMLYELFDARQGTGGAWHAGSGAIFDLGSNALRPAGWTSADAAGLPILPAWCAGRRSRPGRSTMRCDSRRRSRASSTSTRPAITRPTRPARRCPRWACGSG